MSEAAATFEKDAYIGSVKGYYTSYNLCFANCQTFPRLEGQVIDRATGGYLCAIKVWLFVRADARFVSQ
jgi:hypothetical protein